MDVHVLLKYVLQFAIVLVQKLRPTKLQTFVDMIHA